MQDFFSPTERALLCDYFQIGRPPELQRIDISSDPTYGDQWLDSDCDRPLEAVVAHIALAVIQARLPQTACVCDGEVTLCRQRFARPARRVVLLPQHLFTINWADTAPGLSWPEAYHVTYFPEYNRYVVTESQDSADIWGVTDLAIGYFAGDVPLLDGCRDVIVKWWRAECNGCGDQECWAYVWDEGLVDRATARDWGDTVWPPCVEEDDEEAA